MPHATVNDHKSCYINFLFHRHELPYFNLISYRVTTYTVFQKKADTKLVAVTLLIRFSKLFSLSDSPVNLQQSVY